MPHHYTPLDSTEHRSHGWKLQPDFRFAQTDVCAPLLLAEIAHASAIYVVGFTQRPAGGYQLVALLGLRPGENLFVDSAGRWLRDYIPSWYRAYPFRILQGRQDDKQVNMLGFDQDSGLYREQPDPGKREQRFFDDKGQLQPFTRQLVAFLEAMISGERQTQRAVDALAAAQLLEPWPLPVEDPGPNPSPNQAMLSGLYRVGQGALNALEATALHELRDTGALALAYAQMFYPPRLKFLRQLDAAKHAKPPAPQASALPASLDSLLGGNSGTLQFGDWGKQG
jgi:hypothetical protein